MARNTPKSRFTFRGPPLPGLGNPEESRSIPAVCRPKSFGKPSNSCVVRSSVGGAGTVSEENWVVATGNARLGNCDADGDERDRFDGVLLDADSDEPDDLLFFRRAGRGDRGTAWCAAGYW